MKMQQGLFTLMLMGLLAVSPARAEQQSEQKKDELSTGEHVVKETGELLGALKSYSVEQRDKAVAKTQSALDSLDKHIDRLENRIHENWDSMSEASREKAQATLKSLREQRVEVAEWYGSLKSSSGAAWNEIKQGFSDAYAAAWKAWEDADESFSEQDQAAESKK